MLDLAGAVEAEWPDEGVAAHYGDPMREQRAMSERATLVDLLTRVTDQARTVSERRGQNVP